MKRFKRTSVLIRCHHFVVDMLQLVCLHPWSALTQLVHAITVVCIRLDVACGQRVVSVLMLTNLSHSLCTFDSSTCDVWRRSNLSGKMFLECFYIVAV